MAAFVTPATPANLRRMPDPFSLLPLALAAGGGRVDGHDVSQLVAAGVTLLQRCAPLVRAMAAGRAALLLPPGPAFFTALAASDGRGALLLDPTSAPSDLSWQLAEARARALFTLSTLVGTLPPIVSPSGMVVVLLDAAPSRASVLTADRTIDVDLGSHHGLLLEGDQQAAGRDEECVVTMESVANGSRQLVSHTHRALLEAARAAASDASANAEFEIPIGASWAEVSAFTTACGALLTGARLRTHAARDGLATMAD